MKLAKTLMLLSVALTGCDQATPALQGGGGGQIECPGRDGDLQPKTVREAEALAKGRVPSAESQRNRSSLAVRASSLRVEFDAARKGVVARLVSNGRDYASPVARFPLFEVVCCQAGKFTERKTVSARDAKSFKPEALTNGVRLVYRDVGEALAEVVCTVTAKGADVAWRIAATPKPGWALLTTSYPQIALNEQLGSSPVDDCIVTGNSKGGVVRYPMNPELPYWKWPNRRVWRYPGDLVSPFGCFYDDGGGFYTAAYDTEAHVKELTIARWYRTDLPDGNYRDGSLLLRWSRLGYNEGADAQTYDIVTRSFAGPDGAPTTWYDAADIYKAWAHRQKWCKAKFLDRTDLPDWAREAPAVMRFNREWFDRPDDLQWWLTEYWNKKFPGVPLIAILEGWERHGDWVTTEYFPCYPSDATFKEMMGWIKAAGGHPWAWPGGHHWNVTVGDWKGGTRLDFSKDFWARVAPHAVRDPDGKVHLDDLVWLGGGTSASLCPADPWTIDWWNKDVARALVERGSELVQADQDVGGRVPSCWSTEHGHPPGPGQWETQALRHQFETMIDEMGKVWPKAIFSFEEPNEYYNDIMPFVDYRNCRQVGVWAYASVFNYLYHEYVSPFQSGAEMYGRPHWLAFCAADGQMPRLPVRLEYYRGQNVDRADIARARTFCENWVRLYHGKGRKWLAHGRQLRPPEFRCTLAPYEENFRGHAIKNVQPVVYHSLWEARDGSRVLMMANATRFKQDVAWRAADGTWQKDVVEPNGLKLIVIEQK